VTDLAQSSNHLGCIGELEAVELKLLRISMLLDLTDRIQVDKRIMRESNLIKIESKMALSTRMVNCSTHRMSQIKNLIHFPTTSYHSKQEINPRIVTKLKKIKLLRKQGLFTQ